MATVADWEYSWYELDVLQVISSLDDFFQSAQNRRSYLDGIASNFIDFSSKIQANFEMKSWQDWYKFSPTDLRNEPGGSKTKLLHKLIYRKIS